MCFHAQHVFSQNSEPHDLGSTVSRGAGQTITSGLIATGEVTLSNVLVMTYNFLYGAPWAFPNRESVTKNLTEPWLWENTDGFKVNNIGHPIQGLIYHSAGRVNGFNFYESMFFPAFGSSTWEAFSETQQASINDFIVTSVGGFSMGEMFFRLYLEANARGVPAPIATFINPMAGFHRMVTRWQPPNYGKNLHQFYFYMGPIYAQVHSEINPGNKEIFSFRGPAMDMGFSAIYGNPFEQESRVPYKHFELNMSAGMDPGNYMGLRLISDGYLFSFSPVYSEKNFMSTGLSMHYDFVSQGEFDMFDGTIDQSSFALDWTIKYRHMFSKDASFETKFHAGITYLGVSEFYAPALTHKRDVKNYGGGFNGKLYINLIHNKHGRIESSVFFYTLSTYPGTSELSKGTVLWLFTDVAYIRAITKNISIGVADSFALEKGMFGNFVDTYKYINIVKLFVTWSI